MSKLTERQHYTDEEIELLRQQLRNGHRMAREAVAEHRADQETHEQRSCLRKQCFNTCPETGPTMEAYPCTYCGGWHKATKATRKYGVLRYTEEGWPIVPMA